MFEFEIKQITIELIIGFIALLVVSRVIRKTQIKQLTPFDFISAIVLGELLGNAVYDPNVKLWSVIYALILWSVLMLIVEIITQKFNKSRKVIEGEPAIIIRHGQIDYKVIKREKLDINNLLSMLRQKNCFSIREVEYAILEQGGDISILKKSEYDNPKSQDLNLPFKPVFLPVSLILDGVVLKENLEAVGFDEEWLIKQVKNSGLKNIKEVFFAEWKEDEGIHIITRNK
ncbi:MAG: DUF421 domain-containing protein [Clostridiales bacterium]|nr:DUF421 domain-containing protein [Clostridiales bacterium]